MSEKIAIIGMAGRFPGAETPTEMYYNLLKGINSIKKLPNQFCFNKNNYVDYAATIKDVDLFDADFFKFSVRDAELTDPQQRLFLECAYMALENAGCRTQDESNIIGIFGSSSISTYLLNNIITSKIFSKSGLDYSIQIGNDKDFLCTRVAYKLGLTGPAVTIQTACSSSLVAVHMACQSIILGECNIALAGGVSISIPQNIGYEYKEGSTFSVNGECRPFDKNASGMVNGNGCGIVVLKKLSQAIEEKDYIYAVIDSSAINNDGNRKVGFTAPSVRGQKNVIERALSKANITCDDICFVEAHGTGTRLGDPIEIRALSQAFRTNKKQYCAIGSVKANIGHLDAAAGVTGLIKAALSLKNGIIPLNINYTESNEQIDFANTPFYVNTKNVYLKERDKYACVSSFGMGGTNAHIILEKYCGNTESNYKNHYFLIPISAKTLSDLNEYKYKILEYIEKAKTNVSFGNFAYSLCCGRNFYNYRECYIAHDFNELKWEIENNETTTAECYQNTSMLLEQAHKWEEGNSINFASQFKSIINNINKIPIPSYPFHKQRYWIDTQKQDIQRMDNEKVTGYNGEDNIRTRIIKIWKEVLMDQSIDLNDDFFDKGGESLLAIDLVDELSSAFNLKLPVDFLIEYSTPAAIAEYIESEQKKNKKRFSNIYKLAEGNNGKNIFMIHAAGGSIYGYKQLVKYLKTKYTVYAIAYDNTYQFKENSIECVAQRYIEEIKSIQPDGEYYLGGYSFGGNVALEMALQLENNGDVVKDIIMIDSLVPETYAKETPDDREYTKAFPIAMDMNFGKDLFDENTYKNLYIDMDINAIIKTMQENKRLPQKITVNEMKVFYNSWILNHKALTTHRPIKQTNAQIFIIHATERLPLYLTETLNMKEISPDVWGKYSSKTLIRYNVKGNHFSIMNNMELIIELANIMNGIIEIL